MIGVAFIVAAIACCITLLIALSQDVHGRFSMDHDLSGVQKFHTKPVPRVGGIALFFSILLGLGLCSTYTSLLPREFNAEWDSVLLYASSPIFLAGLIEDTTKRVSVVVRLTAAFVSALLASWLLGAMLIRIDIWGVDHLMAMAPFALAVTMVVVAGGVNAMNIIDGFNGLAGGATLIILAGFGILSWEVGDVFVTQLVLLGMGATFGFLLINYPTGRVFLGDGGAYFLGFWISEVAVLLLVRNPSINAWQVLAVCAYPIIEVLFSIYRRKFIRKSSPGQPDCLHLHTLLYRRVVCKLIPYSDARPWLRNALVVWFVGSLIALMTTAALLFGDTIIGAIMVVIGELMAYMVVYARLVRGRWITVPRMLLRLVPGARAGVK